MFDSLFAFFFKYSPYVFQQGELRLALSSPVYIAAGLAAAAALATVLTYRSAPGDASWLDRVVLITLRLCLVGLVLFCLFRPVLILRAAVPQQNFLGILLDDSRSMRVADHDGKPRGEFVNTTFAPDSPVMKALSSRYAVRVFRFASNTDRVGAARDLSFDGTQTKLGEALQRAKDEFTGLPLAGLVMVTDGADTEESSIQESLLGLRASQVPVFTVGIGTRDARPRHPDQPRQHAAQGAEGHEPLGRRHRLAERIPRHDGAAQRRGLRTHPQHAGYRAHQRRRADDGEGALHRQRGRRAHDPVPHPAAARRGNHAEQRARGAARRAGSQGEDSLLRRRAALRGEVHPPRGRRRSEPAARRAAAHDRHQVLPHSHRQPRRAGRGIPEDARRAVLLSRAHPRQHRGQRVQRRPAAHDCRLRRSPRRRPDDDRRPPRVCRRRLCRHAGRRRASGRARIEAAGNDVAHPGDADARRAIARGDADRKDRAGIGEAVGRTAAGHQRESDPPGEAWRHRAAARRRRERPRVDRARVSALRPRQDARLPDLRLVDVADGRQDSGRGHDARNLLAAVDALARRRRARSGAS